jgi:phosphohistidine swiveling domain-containing protein
VLNKGLLCSVSKMGALILDLGSRAALCESVAGGKGASLSRVRRAGFPVPPGFVITTAVFHGALTAAVRRMAAMAAPPKLEDLEAVRASFLSWDILPAHRAAILRAYRKLGGPVAVRSSMVGEDTDKASFAGQLDTVLDVDGEEEVLAAVKRCLASAFGARLWSYLYRKEGAPIGRMAMAVVVQSMIRAAVSGVAFSADPTTCDDAVVIEAVRGPAAALVAGRATPDRFRVGPRGEFDATPSSGAPLLDEARVRELAAAVRAVADKLAAPQDVEWAFDGRRFAILQARPITALASRQVYSRRFLSEIAPGIVTPLLWSMERRSLVNNVFDPLFGEILGHRGLDHSRLIAKFHSRIYADITLVHELAALAGLPADLFERLGGNLAAAEAPRLRFRTRIVPVLFRAVRHGLGQLRAERKVRRFLGAQSRQLEASRTFDRTSASTESLLDELDRLGARRSASEGHLIYLSMNTALRTRHLERLLGKWAPQVRPGDVLKGFGRRGMVQPYEGIARLASDARDLSPRLLARIASEEKMDVPGKLVATPEGRQLVSHFEIFMGRFGFLSAGIGDFSEVPWAENPRPIWKIVARIALSRPTTLWDAAEAERRAALKSVKAGLSPLRGLVFGRMADAAARLMAWREKVVLLMAEEATYMRRCLIALGRRLVSQKWLAAPSDVFYFHEDELKRILADPREAARAWELVNARKAELSADAAADAAETICGGGAAPLPARLAVAAAAGDALAGKPHLGGVGSSPGVATGRARIVRDPFLAADGPSETEILVVPFADVGWLPFLAAAGGIVSETGGTLCHASIIAREMGIPAVVGVAKAASLIREGELVTVDGTAGRVYFHPPERASEK